VRTFFTDLLTKTDTTTDGGRTVLLDPFEALKYWEYAIQLTF